VLKTQYGTLCCRIANSSCATLPGVVFWLLATTRSASSSQHSRLATADVTGINCFDSLIILFCSCLYLSVSATMTQHNNHATHALLFTPTALTLAFSYNEIIKRKCHTFLANAAVQGPVSTKLGILTFCQKRITPSQTFSI